MDTFEKALKFTFDHEGILSNDKYDPGGLTKYGISQRSFPNLDIKNLTLEDAKNIYKQYYWNKCKCNLMSNKVAIAVFDFAVNSGCKNSIKTLQNAIINCGIPLEPDGIIGKQTLGAISKVNEDNLITELLESREMFYKYLVDKSPKLGKFIKGWLNRVNDLSIYLNTID